MAEVCNNSELLSIALHNSVDLNLKLIYRNRACPTTFTVWPGVHQQLSSIQQILNGKERGVTETPNFFSRVDQTSYSLYLKKELLRSAMNITVRKFHVEYESFLTLRGSK